VFVLRRATINPPEVASSVIVNDATVQPLQICVRDNRQAAYALIIFQATAVLWALYVLWCTWPTLTVSCVFKDYISRYGELFRSSRLPPSDEWYGLTAPVDADYFESLRARVRTSRK
jgi:hypothetical protein